jgi:hypothetical protein
MADSSKQTLCILTFSLPSALLLFGGILYFFWPKFKDFATETSIWIQTGWRQQVTSFVGVVLAIFTIFEIYTAWYKLANPSVELAEKMPSDRCVPFFYLAQEFIDANPRTTAIYAYDNGRALLRLCTDAPEDAVVRKFQNDSIISRLPTKAGCSWEQLTASCTVTDRSSPSKPVPTCPQLLDTPPLPNGFLYKSTVKVDDTASCTLQIFVNQDLPTCKYKSVYRLQNQTSQLVSIILAVGLSVPSAFLIHNILTFYKTNQMKKNGEPLTKDHMNAFAFAMEGPIGCIIGTLKMERCYPFPLDDVPPLTWQYFAFLQFQTVVEAVLLPVMAVSGCSICQYYDIVALIVAKGIQFLWTVKKFYSDVVVSAKPENAASASLNPA